MQRTLSRTGALCIALLLTLATYDGPASIAVHAPGLAPAAVHPHPLPGPDSLRRPRTRTMQEARTLFAQGLVLYKRSSYDSAMACFTEARRLFVTSRDDYGVSQSELNRGNVYLKRDEPDSAYQCFLAARRLAEGLHEDLAIAEAYLGLATWFQEERNSDSARAFLTPALAVFMGRGERIREADARITLGNLHVDDGKYADALVEYERSIGLFESAGQSYHLAMALMNHANALAQLGRRREALTQMLASDSISSRIGSVQLSATLAGNMARTLMQLKQTDSARMWYERQLTLGRMITDRKTMVSALVGLGSRALDLRQFDTAAIHLFRALGEAEKIKDKSILGNVLANIGRMNLLSKTFDKSEEYYRQALAVLRTTQHLNGIFFCLAGFATLEEELGRLDAALVHRLECLRIAEQTGWNHQIAMAKRNLGRLLTLRGDSDSGKVLIQEAIDTYMATTPQSVGCSYNDLGAALAASRQDSLARVIFQTAVLEATRAREMRCLQDAHTHLSMLYRRAGDSARALRHLLIAVGLRDSLEREDRITTMTELQTRYESDKQRYKISLLEKEQEVSRLHIRQQQQELASRTLLADQQRQRILLFERDDQIKELRIRQKTDSLHVRSLENSRLEETTYQQRFEFNALLVGTGFILAFGFLLVRHVQGKRRETQLLAEALDHKARAAEAETIRTQAAALQREHETQAQYTRQLIQSQEDERRRLSRELHDGLGQSLTVLRNSALLGLRSDDVAVMRRQLEGMSNMIADTLDDVRAITRDLRPVQLEHLGLTGTLRGLLARIAEETPLHVTHDIADLGGLFRPAAEINVFRLVQEAMSNMLRHAQAETASIRITHDGSHVDITVVDDGIGFDPDAPDVRSGLGIRGMHERVMMLRGTIAIDSAPHRGTRVHIRLPIDM